MFKTLRYFCFGIIILISGLAHAQEVTWQKGQKELTIGDKITFWVDSTKKSSLEDIFQNNFYQNHAKPSTQIIPNFEFNDAVYWLHFTLDNPSKEKILLEVGQARLPWVEFHYQDSLGNWQTEKAGYEVPITDKYLEHHLQLFSLPPNAHEFYLRLPNIASPIPLTIWNHKVYEEKANVQKIIYGIYIGIMIFVLLNNLFLFFSLRKFTYLHYSLLVFMYATFAIVNDGFILYVMPVDLMKWFTLNPILNQPNGLLYCMLFIEVKKYRKTLYKIGIGLFVYLMSYTIWYQFLPPMFVLQLSPLHTIIGLFFMISIGISVGRKGNKLGYYFSASYAIFLLILIVEISYITTGSPSYFFELSHVAIGIFVEVFLLAFILSKRFEWEQKEMQEAKEKAQQELLLKTQENERIVREQNIILEQKVQERTRELSEKNKEVQQQNEEINQQNEELVSITEELQTKNEVVNAQNIELIEQKQVIEKTHKKITASINYAERIQNAMLPHHQAIVRMLPDIFIFFRPRDVVSGDFYWCSSVNTKGKRKIVFVTADCTGHGVPGAFMSMAGANLLAQIINDRKITDPAFILSLLHGGIRNLLRQDETENRDGMDMSISVVDWEAKMLEYGAAKRPLWYFQNNEMHQIKGDIYPVGGYMRNVKRKFTNHQISFAESPIMAYTFSDGYPDQIGMNGRKFMTRKFRKLLTEIAPKSINEQAQIIENELQEWQGNVRQLDDILVVGMRLG